MFLYETVFLCGDVTWGLVSIHRWSLEGREEGLTNLRDEEGRSKGMCRSVHLTLHNPGYGNLIFFWNFQLIDWGKRKMGNWIRQDLGFCIDNYVDEQMAKGVEVKELIEKQDLESELHRASEDGRGWWTVRKWIVDSWMGSLQKVEELWQRWSSEKWVESRRDSGLNARGLKWRCWR